MTYFSDLATITLLAGQNNSGKSNTLRFIRDFLRRDPEPLGALDVPRGDENEELGIATRMSIAFRFDDDVVSKLMGKAGSNPRNISIVRRLLRATGKGLPGEGDGVAWFVYKKLPGAPKWDFDDEWFNALLGLTNPSSRELRDVVLEGSGHVTGPPSDVLLEVIQPFDPLKTLPPVRVIEAFRQIRHDSNTREFTPEGSDLVETLARYEQSGPTRRADRRKFDAVNGFLRRVLEDDSATLSVARDPDLLLVQQAGRHLPLENLGTGIHQVIIMAAVATLFEGHVLAIEEPEVHLHPLLQRKLGVYLSTQEQNQYVIATHSAHLFDLPASSTYHLRLTVEGTSAVRAESPAALSRICADLGYRPSDLLQANFVIWVEGPSDRIYIRHWIAQADRRLLEHVHYSVMFYGGRLLAHLSAHDEDVDDFIRLHRLNRSMAVVIDSDRRQSTAGINSTKARVVDELSSDPSSLAWVTDGREIENYIPADIFADAFSEVSGRDVATPIGQFDQAVPRGPGEPFIDKVKIARRVVEAWGEGIVGQHGLEARVDALTALIVSANGMLPVGHPRDGQPG
ncbi:AAA family ATPase [Geodermatophilus nigrescens]|nr:AAA family ATPase [Geodermatophilus nigrescens]